MVAQQRSRLHGAARKLAVPWKLLPQSLPGRPALQRPCLWPPRCTCQLPPRLPPRAHHQLLPTQMRQLRPQQVNQATAACFWQPSLQLTCPGRFACMYCLDRALSGGRLR
jgi:hypothetical protein